MKNYVLGLDNGSTAIKAVLFDLKGREIAAARRFSKIIRPKPGYAQRNMEELWEVNCQCIREVLSKTQADSQDILGIGVCGHGKGLYLWGKNETLIYPGILSADNRAAEYLDRKLPKRLLPGQQAMLLAWMKEHEREVYDKIQYVFSVKDYIRFRLTGQAYSELTDLSGSGLFDPQKKCLDMETLKALDIADIVSKIPPAKYSQDICGRITPRAAAQTGLSQRTLVAGGMFDIDSCAVGGAVLDPGQMCMITGTWSINEYIAREPVADNGSTMNSIFAIPEYYLVEECSPTSAGNLEWILDNLLGEKENNKQKCYEKVNAMVDSLSPEDCNVYFLPYLYGSNTHIFGKSAFVGMTSYHDLKHLLRAVYEGVAFSHRTHVEKLLKKRPKPSCIRMAGGAVNSPVWVQIFADVLDCPIEVVKIKEIGALGCAMSAAVAAGIYKDYKMAADNMVCVSDKIFPRREYTEIYDKKYKKYKAVCKALDSIWDELKD